MENKTIILAKLEVNEAEELFPPFGLMYLSDALEAAGFKTEIWHRKEKDLNNLYMLVERLNPLFVGFTTYTMPILRPTIKASKGIKKRLVPVVWGGVHATILPELCINEDFVDFLVLREGEEAVVELANALSKKRDLEGIPGIVFNSKGKIINNGFRQFITNLDKYRPRWDKSNVERYLQKQEWGDRIIPFVTSRGCPFRCGFCYSPIVNKRNWRMHSEEFIIKQIEDLKCNYKIDGVSFRDENFFVNKKRAMKIIENIHLPFYASIRADSLDGEFIKWLDEHNCKEIFIGAESGVDRMLRLMNKDISSKDIKTAVAALAKTDIKILAGFIIGFPGETRAEQIETLEFMEKLHELDGNIKTSINCYTPYPETPLWQNALENGFSPPKDNEGWAEFDRINVSRHLPWMNVYKFATMVSCLNFATKQIYTNQTNGRLMATKGKKVLLKIIEPIMKLRWKKKWFMYPFEMIVFLKIKKFRSRLMRLGGTR